MQAVVQPMIWQNWCKHIYLIAIIVLMFIKNLCLEQNDYLHFIYHGNYMCRFAWLFVDNWTCIISGPLYIYMSRHLQQDVF